MSVKLSYLSAKFLGAVDAAKGLVTGVSVITCGEARGHDMVVDALTLNQVKSCAETYTNGLKVKLDHFSGVDAIVGYLKNFRIDGQKLLADLDLFQTHPKRDYVLELAQKIPDNFGLSIMFSGTHEEINGIMHARCDEIYSADLVSEPAANASGLFEIKTEKPAVDTSKNIETPISSNKEKPMTPEQLKELAEQLSKAVALALTPPPAKEKSEDEKAKELDAKIDGKVQAVLTSALSKIGVAAVGTSSANEPAKTEDKKSFMQLVEERVQNGKKKSEAILFCSNNFPTEYKEFREKSLNFTTSVKRGNKMVAL